MKKLLTYFLYIALIIGLTACSEDKPDTSEEVLEASIKAVNPINSYHTDMEIKQEGVYGLPFKQTSNTAMDYVKEPEGIYLKTKTRVDQAKVEGQLYFAEGDVYQKDTVIDHWVKGKETGFHLWLSHAKEQLNLTKRLEWLQTHADDIEMEVKDGDYILTLTGSGDTYQEWSKQTLDISMPAFYQSKFGKDLKNNGFTYTVHIGEEDFLLTKVITEADLQLTVDDDAKILETKTTIEEDISNFDGIDPIEVPDTVLDSAVDNKTGEKAN
jgi:methyl coenzyme M reductase subunit D